MNREIIENGILGIVNFVDSNGNNVPNDEVLEVLKNMTNEELLEFSDSLSDYVNANNEIVIDDKEQEQC